MGAFFRLGVGRVDEVVLVLTEFFGWFFCDISSLITVFCAPATK